VKLLFRPVPRWAIGPALVVMVVLFLLILKRAAIP
jgi:hypothetical protein